MGLTLLLQNSYCSHCKRAERICEFDCAYDLSPIWRAIYPESSEMVKIEGLSGIEALPVVNKAIEIMINEKEVLEKLSPPNRWGGYESFLKFLRDVRDACEEYPYATWVASR